MPLITSETARRTLSDIYVPTSTALLTAFPADVIQSREDYWKKELDAVRTAVRDELVYIRSVQNFFRKAVAWALRVNLGEARELADTLWDDPDRAPAFRLEIELTVHTLSTPHPKWSGNDFFDHIHAGALAYVDYFVTRDGLGKKRGLIQKIDWYDTHVRLPRQKAPYARHVCRGWDELEHRLRDPDA